MMNKLKGLGGMSFDQVVTEIAQDGEYYTAYVTVYVGSFMAGRERYAAEAMSRDQHKALGYALEDIAKQVQKGRRRAP